MSIRSINNTIDVHKEFIDECITESVEFFLQMSGIFRTELIALQTDGFIGALNEPSN